MPRSLDVVWLRPRWSSATRRSILFASRRVVAEDGLRDGSGAGGSAGARATTAPGAPAAARVVTASPQSRWMGVADRLTSATRGGFEGGWFGGTGGSLFTGLLLGSMFAGGWGGETTISGEGDFGGGDFGGTSAATSAAATSVVERTSVGAATSSVDDPGTGLEGHEDRARNFDGAGG